ncbi:MAG: glycosyltransferase family 39 protein [Saprospiraceae bacterium]|nr:glycosyltransferase family 39 protein [Saprospiraceae bacterium]
MVIKYINTERDKWLIWMGVAIGLGLLNKYSVAFLIFGLFPFLIFTKHRNLFKRKAFYLMLIIAFILFLPNLIWQIQHQLPVIRYMQELAATQFVNISVAGFILDQFFFFMAAVPLWLLGIYFLLFTEAGKKWKGLAWMYFSVLVLLLLLRGKSYYTIGVYPVLIAAGAAYLEKLTSHKIWIPAGLATLMLFLALPQFPIILPIYPPEKEAAFLKKKRFAHHAKCFAMGRWTSTYLTTRFCGYAGLGGNCRNSRSSLATGTQQKNRCDLCGKLWPCGSNRAFW